MKDGNPSPQLTVVFMDISGSTQLYDREGDTVAASMVHAALDRMEQIVVGFNGHVIKHIGDELMCRFDSPVNAVHCAAELLYLTSNVDNKSAQNSALLPLRMGMHHGEVLPSEDGDIFGDTVNLAARIIGLAKKDEALLSEEVVNLLPRETRYRIRCIGEKYIKGKGDIARIYQYLLPEDEESEDGKTIIRGQGAATRLSKNSLLLRTPTNDYLLNRDHPSIEIGRSTDCALITPDPEASRHHAKIELRGNYFWLSDSSANGTVVHTDSGERFSLRREELRLPAKGTITVGQEFIIQFALDAE